jgi:DNA repair exonuclease SbcCD ATPase subunit
MTTVLKQIEIENFLSIKSAVLPLAGQGVVLVEGVNKDSASANSNGSGKSALFEALLFSLFGKTHRGLVGNDVINRKAGKNCSVRLQLEIDGKQCEIARYRKHSKFGDSLQLEVDRKKRTMMTSLNTQAEIENLVGFKCSSFVSSVYFGQTLAHFSSLTDADQKHILDDLLGFSMFPAYQKTAREGLSKRTLRQSQIASEVLSTEEGIKGIGQRLVDFERAKTEQQETLEAEIKNIEQQITYKEGKIQDTNQEVLKLNQRIAGEAKKAFEANQLQEQLNKLKYVNQVQTEELKRKEKQLEEYRARMAERGFSICPVIKKECPRDKEKSESDRKVSEDLQTSGIKDCKTKIQENTRQMNTIKEQIVKLSVSSDNLPHLEDALSTLHNELSALSSSVLSLKGLLTEKKRKQQEASDLDALIDKEIQRLRMAKNKLEKLGTEALVVEAEVERFSFWEKGFSNSGLKSYLLDEFLPILNEQANVFASSLFYDEFKIEFSPQSLLKSGELRERLDIRLYDTEGETTYEASSGGERRRVDVCILLALSELAAGLGRVPNIVVLDEVFDQLDAVGIERVVALLQSDLLKERDSIFVITHNPSLSEFFDRRIRVVKENGFSLLENNNG